MSDQEYAFPQLIAGNDSPGLTLHDFAAIEAMKGILGNPEFATLSRERIVNEAILLADCFLAERSKGRE